MTNEVRVVGSIETSGGIESGRIIGSGTTVVVVVVTTVVVGTTVVVVVGSLVPEHADKSPVIASRTRNLLVASIPNGSERTSLKLGDIGRLLGGAQDHHEIIPNLGYNEHREGL